jgi:hypothetical protein
MIDDSDNQTEAELFGQNELVSSGGIAMKTSRDTVTADEKTMKDLFPTGGTMLKSTKKFGAHYNEGDIRSIDNSKSANTANEDGSELFVRGNDSAFIRSTKGGKGSPSKQSRATEF